MKTLRKIVGVVIGVGFLTPALASAGNAVAKPISNRPILLIHGFSPLGLPEDCANDWKKMESTLKANGFTGTFSTVSYYNDDTHCDVKTSPHGTILTNIRELSKDLAWYIYNQYSVQNVAIDIVAHSMGGLMTRYALARVAVKDPEFPPALIIPHVATMGSPFTGYSLLGELCHVNVLNIQCDQMFPGSPFISDLNSDQPLVPQGMGGTAWRNIGSKADILDSSDGFVTAKAATSMNIPASEKISLPWHMLVFHTSYTKNKTVISLVSKFLSDAVENSSGLHAFALDNTEVYNPSANSPDSESQIVLSKNDVTADFELLPTEQRPAEIKPHLENDEDLGVEFSQVLPEGIFAKMGIQDGDNVRGCTADNVNSPFEGIQSLQSSSAPVKLDLCIYRNGEKIVQQIKIQ